MLIIADFSKIKLFARSTIDILNYIDAAVGAIDRDSAKRRNNFSKENILVEDVSSNKFVNQPNYNRMMENRESRMRIQSMIENKKIKSSNDFLNMSIESTRVENIEEIWPPLIDPKISMIIELFNSNADQQWNRETIKYWTCVMFVMQLRFQYGLRGVKPSILFEDKNYLANLANEVYYLSTVI
jgi:hypothetical protein